jgi:Tfp pilus assembly protein PilP
MDNLWSQEGERASATASSRPSSDRSTQNQNTEQPARSFGSSTAPAIESIKRRDPFKPFYSNSDHPDPARKRTLQEYDLSELRVTAIIADKLGNSSASLAAPNGQSFIVKVGSYVGKQGGQVEVITDAKVVITTPNESSPGSGPAARRELSLKGATER